MIEDPIAPNKDVPMKRRLWKYFLGVGLSLICTGCNAQTAVEEDNRQQRDLVRVTFSEPPAASENSLQPVGILSDNANGCKPIIAREPLFSQPKAQAAFEAYASKRYAEAAREFETLLESEAASWDAASRQRALFLAALSRDKMGDAPSRTQAIEWMKRAQAEKADLGHTAAMYGIQISYAMANWKSVVHFAEALAGDPDYRTYLAIALANLGQYDASAAEFERISAFPRALRLDALQAQALVQQETAQLKAALETYRRIYELDPKSSQGQLAQEAIMAEQHRWPSGFVFPRPTAKTDKSKSAREIAAAHFDAHRSEQAISAYTKLLRDDKKNKDTARICEDLYAIARSYVKLRKHTDSLPFFEEALETCRNTELEIRILYTAARAAWNAGRTELAMRWYQVIIDRYADHSYADDAYHFQAQILLGQNRTSEALAKMREQIRLYPTGDMAKDTYWLLMSNLYESGQYKEAIAFVDDNLKHAGEDDLYTQGRLRYFQGRAFEKIANTQSAIQNFLHILNEFPLSYYAMLSLGRLEVLAADQAALWVQMHRKRVYQPDDAENYCFHAIGDSPSFSAARQLTAMALYTDALTELTAFIDSTNPRIAFEGKLARAILLKKQARHSESARLAASLLRPAHDLNHQAYAAWLLTYPMPWKDIVSKSATPGSNLFYIVYAIMREESYYDPKAESWANARGLMQIMLPTAQSMASELGMPKPVPADLFKPEVSIPLGAGYLAKLHRILIPHPMFVLPGYNAGQGNVGKWITRFADAEVDLYVEKIPFKEARHYAKRVGMTLWRYHWLYDETLDKPFDPAIKVKDLKTHLAAQ